LERAWDALLEAGHAEATARQYVSWMRDYVLFHDKRHPQEMGVPEVRAFLANGRFSGPAAAQRVEATAAIRFLYGKKWGREEMGSGLIILQKRPGRGVLAACRGGHELQLEAMPATR